MVESLFYLQEYLFIILSAALLFLTYHFIEKGRFDERRKSRFRRAAIIRQVNHYKQFLHSEEDDLFLRRHVYFEKLEFHAKHIILKR